MSNTTEMVQKSFEKAVAESMSRYGDFDGVCLASIAVSLKRIADAAEGEADTTAQHHELVVFYQAKYGLAAGFLSSGRHRTLSYIRGWWPALGMRGLSGPPPYRVTIPATMAHHATPEGKLVDILRKRQAVFEYPIWIET